MNIRVRFLPKRHQWDYITLDKIHRMYKAFRFQAKLVGNNHCYYEVKNSYGFRHVRKCDTFEKWVDLHTKISKLYKVY